VPRPGGKPLAPITAECCENAYDFHDGLPEMRQAVEDYTKAGVKLDYCWRDAGWYACDGWWLTGTWEPDPKRFPQGFKPFSDWLHARGLKFIVWFEPERTTPNTWLTKNHPEWVHGGKNGGLLDLGNPHAWKWLVNHVDRLLTEQGIDLYRQDFNMDPLDSWRKADSPDRQGIAENKHVAGYLAYWDELLRRHPGMPIDSCASGGRRNDLETLRRAVPLLRSDYQGGPDTALGNQGHTYGLSSWVPYYGSGVYATDKYSVRSYFMPCFGVATDPRQKVDWPAVARAYRECNRVAAYMLGDYYPLTPYSLQTDQWIAWQFDCPEKGEGMVQAFRREKSLYESIRVQIHGLDPNAVYTLSNFDVAGSTEMGGRQLTEQGLSIVIGEPRGSAVITYKKKP
jgi:alpha-galactosidase